MGEEGGVPGSSLYSMWLSTPENKIEVESKFQSRASPCKMRTESEGETEVLRRHSKAGAGRLCLAKRSVMRHFLEGSIGRESVCVIP